MGMSISIEAIFLSSVSLLRPNLGRFARYFSLSYLVNFSMIKGSVDWMFFESEEF